MAGFGDPPRRFADPSTHKPEALQRYVREHVDGEREHSFQLWTFLMLELWYRQFID